MIVYKLKSYQNRFKAHKNTVHNSIYNLDAYEVGFSNLHKTYSHITIDGRGPYEIPKGYRVIIGFEGQDTIQYFRFGKPLPW